MLNKIRIRIHGMLVKEKKPTFQNPYSGAKVVYRDGMVFKNDAPDKTVQKSATVRTKGLLGFCKDVIVDDLAAVFKRTSEYKKKQKQKITDKAAYDQFMEMVKDGK